MRPRHWMAIVGVSVVSVALLAARRQDSKTPAGADDVYLKIYALSDLVGPTRARRNAPAFRSLADWSSPIDSDADDHLARLESVLRPRALPGASWRLRCKGAIASYPEKFSLVVRQTKTGHQAIESLLAQLRAEDDFEIETQIEVGDFDRKDNGEETSKCLQMLGRPLAAEELTQLQKHFRGQVRTNLRLQSGRATVAAGELIGFMPRLTAVASADRASVEMRLDHITDDIRPDGTFSYSTQVKTIPVGKTMALTGHCDGSSFVMLVTPQIVARGKL